MPRRHAGSVGAVVLAMAIWGSPGNAQTALSPSLARVLAEAADGNRTGAQLWFAANQNFPHRLTGPYESERQARDAARDSGSTWGAFGPFVTPRDSVEFNVVSVTLTIQRDGRTEQVTIDPRQVDALFLSMAAVDKFMIPYYSRIYGSAYGAALRERIASAPGRLRAAPVPCHITGTSAKCAILLDPGSRFVQPLDIPGIDIPGMTRPAGIR